jgi:hypothetical protein
LTAFLNSKGQIRKLKNSLMNTQIENVLVFRSNIGTEEDMERVSSVLDGHPMIEQWSLDLNDVDFVLRVISCSLKQCDVIALVANCGYACEELGD